MCWTLRKSAGKVVLGKVAGDIHDIGKNIVGAISPQEKKTKAFLFFKKKPKSSGKGIIWSEDRQVTIPNFMVVALIPGD